MGRTTFCQTYRAAIGTPAMASSTARKRRSSSGERLVTPAIVVEVDKKRGGACSGHRLDRIAPGDTPLVSAPLYGRCLLVEANLCVNCGGPGRTNCVQVATLGRPCQGVCFPNTTLIWNRPSATITKRRSECQS